LRKKYLYVLLGFSLLFVLSGCMMNILDITLDPGIYLGYSKNSNVPDLEDQLTYDERFIQNHHKRIRPNLFRNR